MSLNSTLLVAYLIWMIGGQFIATSMVHPIHHKTMLVIMIVIAYLVSQLLGFAVLAYYKWFTEEKNRSKFFRYTFIFFTWQQYSEIQNAIKKPSGMILMCGPTGSGKTTTMYAMLNEIDRYTRNVITVEDPIEAMLPETSQIEINPKADITFAKALRSILRQDPDVICVGEIRDEETADIALRASQTGHLVLATIHCHSNPAALIRLLDLGVSPLLLSSGLSLLISQRLVRRLCENCKTPAVLNEHLIREFQSKHLDCTNMFEAQGCRRCDGTGYFGRMAVLDIMPVTDELKAGIAENKALIDELKNKGKKKSRTNLRNEGLKKVSSGKTSLEELKRVIG